MKTDEELMTFYVAGESAAFSELYQRYKNRVYGHILKKIPAHQCEDVFQKIFMKLHEKKHLWKAEYPFAPWFFTLSRNVVIDHLRAQKIIYEELLDEPILEDKEINKGNLENENFPGLDSMQLKLLYLKFVEQYDYKELETEFNANASTLRKRISRLIAMLRKDRA